MSIYVITKSSVEFTQDTLKAYINECGLIDVNHFQPVHGVFHTSTANYVIIGVYSRFGNDANIRAVNVSTGDLYSTGFSGGSVIDKVYEI